MNTRFVSIFIAVLFLLSVAMTVQAAPGAGGKKARAGMSRQMDCGGINQLGLSDEQKGKIGDILKQFRTDVRGVVGSTATREEKKTQVAALKTKAADAIMAVLTPEQKAKATESKWIKRILSPKGHRGHGLVMILRQLNLTEEQKASVKAIMQESATQGKAIREDTTLTREQKMAKLVEHRKATIEKIAGVLTPEQQTKFRELLAKLPQPGARGGGRRS